MTSKALLVAATYLVAVLTTPALMSNGAVPDTTRTLAERLRENHIQREVECLAHNIFYEAASESYTGMLAVATVTMNRVKSSAFPQTVCGVVYQRGKRGCQFSWTCSKAKTQWNARLYDRAYVVAEQAFAGKRVASIGNAVYFHNTTITPEWNFAVPIKQIGNHIFYVPKRKNG